MPDRLILRQPTPVESGTLDISRETSPSQHLQQLSFRWLDNTRTFKTNGVITVFEEAPAIFLTVGHL